MKLISIKGNLVNPHYIALVSPIIPCQHSYQMTIRLMNGDELCLAEDSEWALTRIRDEIQHELKHYTTQ